MTFLLYFFFKKKFTTSWNTTTPSKKNIDASSEKILYEEFSYLKTQNEQLLINFHLVTDENENIKFLNESLNSKNNDLKKILFENETNFIVLEEKYKKISKEHNKIINDQRLIINQKNTHIENLEDKLKDIVFEIKTILNKDSFSKPSICHINLNQDDFSKNLLIDKLTNIKAKLETFSSETFLDKMEFDNTPFNISSLVNSHNIVFRSFFDSLKEEEPAIIFIYSKIDKKYLFTSSLFKYWIGWKEDFFAKETKNVILEGENDWVNNLTSSFELKEGCITIQTKTKGKLLFYYYITNLEKGPFKTHTLGILYPLDKKITVSAII